MNGLSSIYVNKLAKYCLKNFVQVIPCDHLKYFQLKVGDQFIINLSDSSKVGSHFISISIKEKEWVYFDSFGSECENRYILKELEKYEKRLICAPKQVQSLNSFFCAYFTIAHLISDEKKMSLKIFLEIFESENLEKNDQICIDFIILYIKNMK